MLNLSFLDRMEVSSQPIILGCLKLLKNVIDLNNYYYDQNMYCVIVQKELDEPKITVLHNNNPQSNLKVKFTGSHYVFRTEEILDTKVLHRPTFRACAHMRFFLAVN